VRLIRHARNDQQQGHVFSYISPEQRVRKDHPLRPIRAMVDKVLKELSPEFDKMYSKVGLRRFRRSSCCALCCCQMLYSVRSERLLMEEIDYNILFRWFVGLNLDDAVWMPRCFTKNRRPFAGGRSGLRNFWCRWWSKRESRDGPRTSTSRGRHVARSLGQREEFSTKEQESFTPTG